MKLKLILGILLPLAIAVSCNGSSEGDTPDEKNLTAPQNVTLTESSETTLTFQWGAVQGADSYAWRLTQSSVNVADGTTADTRVTVAGLGKGSTYSFAVRALKDSKTSSWSQTLTATTEDNTPPDPSVKTQLVDAPLVLTLGEVPELGTSGSIRIFRKGGTEVDRINLSDLAGVKIREDGCMVPSGTIGNNTEF